MRAWIGGRDFQASEFDRVDQSRRQVGSLVKPFLVALAQERGQRILIDQSQDEIVAKLEELKAIRDQSELYGLNLERDPAIKELIDKTGKVAAGKVSV